MTTPVIQELTIDARGAAAGSALYVRAMQAAQSAVDRLIDRERLQGEQQRAGVPITEQAAQSTTRLAMAFDKLRGSVDPATKMQIAHQREIERAMVTTDSAVRRGLSTQEEAAKIITQIRARQVAEVNVLTAAEQRHNSAQAAGMSHANNNNRQGNFNTANIAAQFQDIAVTSAMGMNPLQIALQQGTQLSAVLGGQGLTGVVKSLGAAFAAIISPVSLITIGVVALGAAGIQWLMGMTSGAEKSEEALKKHSEWLDKILVGYDSAAAAAKNAAEEAAKLPQGSVESNLQADRNAKEKEFLAILERIKAVRTDTLAISFRQSKTESAAQFPGDTDRLSRFDDLIAEAGKIDQLAQKFANGSIGVDQLHTALTDIINSGASPAIADVAREMLRLADEALNARGQVEATGAALKNIKAIGDININLSIRTNLDTALSGMEKLKALTPDLRTEYQKVDDALSETLLANSNLPMMLRQTMDAGAKQAAVTAKSTLDLQAAQEAAAKAAAAGGKANDKLADAYGNVIANANDRIAQAQLEAAALGMTDEAAARLRVTHDLLTQAEQAGLVMDKDKIAELTKLGVKLADTESRTKALTKAQQDQQAQTKGLLDTITSTIGTLFSKPIADAREFFSVVLNGFASLGQANLKKSLDGIFAGNPLGAAANDNGGGGGWAEARAGIYGAIKAGAKDGTEGGFADVLKNIPGGAGTVSAGLGGLGMGYQTQNPLMGAAGGALAGMSAGPIGAVVGGIAGFIGGLWGMHDALVKAQATLKDNRVSIEAFIGAGYGKEISEQTKALEAYKAQAREMIKLAEAAGDAALVRRIKEAAEAYKDTLKSQALRDRFDSARDDAIEAYRREADVLQGVIDRTEEFISSMNQFRDSLKLDKTLSTLSPEQMMVEAKRQFDLLVARARTGDAEAQGQLQGAASNYLNAARGYYGSSEDYTAIFGSVDQVLQSVVGSANMQITNAQAQLDAVNQSLVRLGDIHSAVMSVNQAMRNLIKLEAAAAKLRGEDAKDLLQEIKALNRKLAKNDLKKAA